MVIYSGEPLKSVCYDPIVLEDASFDRGEWVTDKENLIKRNPLMNLPYLIDKSSNGDEILISQTNACFMYLGRKYSMLGSNDLELSQCEQLLCEV